ncbi:serine hydrolase domain-containing protein [Streptomyces longwoodensis]|uniref:serine hydrolase domain-containing protein n=1 Tax=Streptomyces longwoodensis TaxID=68231 RepID=UPI0037B2A546
MRRAIRRGRAVVTALALGGVTAFALCAPDAAHASRGGGYGTSDLRHDLAAVRRAAGGDATVLARVDAPGGRVVRARTGTATAGSAAPVPWDARFRIASTTKTFTAVVVLQLAAERRLSLDDTVEHWLPGLVAGHGNDGRRITVRNLLRQTSGLFDYVDDPGFQEKLTGHFEEIRYDATPAADLVAVALRHPPLFVPAPHGPVRWAYSNTNYLLAQLIAEKASGTGWRELVEHRLVARLGLRGTDVPGLDPFLTGPHASVYLDGPDGTRLDLTDHSLQHTADSGVVSTTADLDTFFRALAAGRLLPAEQWREMRRAVTRTDAPEDLREQPTGTYGLGLRKIPLSCGGSYYTHEGDGLGAYTRPAVTEDGRRAVTVSVTSRSALPDLPTLDRATGALVDHALCAGAAGHG